MKAIILMTRMPQPGTTKTRLMSHLSGEECANLHQAFLKDYAQCFEQLRCGAPFNFDVILAYAPEHFSEARLKEMPFGGKWFVQEGMTLGERMAHAFKSVENMGYQEMLLVGSDLPQLQPQTYLEAFNQLNQADLILGPTQDGGYFLIGMKAIHEALFANTMGWGQLSVYESTCEVANQLGLVVGNIAVERDVDTFEDLLALKNQLESETHYEVFPFNTNQWMKTYFEGNVEEEKDLLKEKIEWYCSLKKVKEALHLTDFVKATFLAQGEYNINYLVESNERRFVFRLNTASQLQLDNQIAYEYDALRQLEVSGVTPKPLYLDDSKTYFEYGILCMDFLEGRPLAYHLDLHHAARLFATIHNLDVSNFQGVLIEENHLCQARVDEGDRWLSDYRNCGNGNEETLRILESLLTYCRRRARVDDVYFEENKWVAVNNTEVNSHNFIIGEKSQYIIDWEKPVLSDPVQDITQFLAPTTTLWRSDYLFSDEEINQFYTCYKIYSLRDASDLRERVERYKPYLYLRALSWCAHAWVGYEGERVIQNAETYDKIKMYLEPMFMGKLLAHYKLLEEDFI